MKIETVDSQAFRENGELAEMCAALAKLHVEGSPHDLLSHLGEGFLKNVFYWQLVSFQDAVLLVIKEGRSIIGFVSATVGMGRFLRRALTLRPFHCMGYFLGSMLSHPGIGKALASVVRMKSPKMPLSTAEILMITVSRTHRGQGLGDQLLAALDRALQHRGIRHCIARVREDSAYALKMYQKNSYAKIGSVRFNNASWSWLARTL